MPRKTPQHTAYSGTLLAPGARRAILQLAALDVSMTSSHIGMLLDCIAEEIHNPYLPAWASPLCGLLTARLLDFEHASQDQTEIAHAITGHYQLQMAKHLLQEQLAKKLLTRLADSGTELILLKGAAFNGRIYTEDKPRIGNDIDLLVRTDDYDSVSSRILEELEVIPTDESRQATFENLFEREFWLPGTSLRVDLHRALTSKLIFSIDNDGLFRESKPHPGYGNERIRVLCTEHDLIHLAIHVFRDFDLLSKNLLDAHTLWLHAEPDHAKLLDYANAWGARHALFFLLQEATNTFGTPIPQTLLESLSPQPVRKRLGLLAYTKIAGGRTEEPDLRYRFFQYLGQLVIPDHLSQTLRFQARYVRLRLADLFPGKPRSKQGKQQ